MSRRHNSARRRNYGRRLHEIRERRPDTPRGGEWQAQATVNEVTVNDEWRVTDPDDEHPPAAGQDGYGGFHL